MSTQRPGIKTSSPYPHQGNCLDCRREGLCNYCGIALSAALPVCTNGRCSKCHAEVCTGGGSTSPGHHYGLGGRGNRH